MGFLPPVLIELHPRRERSLSRKEQVRGKRQNPPYRGAPRASGRPRETMKAAPGDGAKSAEFVCDMMPGSMSSAKAAVAW